MTTPIWTWPENARAAVNSQFYLAPQNLSAMSPYTGEATVYGPTVQRWTAKITLPPKTTNGWRALSGFITRLRGIGGHIRMKDYHRQQTQYDMAVTPTIGTFSDGTKFSDGTGWATGFLPPVCVSGEARGRGSTDLLITALPVSLAAVLQAGDLIELRPNGQPAAFGMLHEVVDTARTNSSGQTRIDFEPGLRIDIAAGDQVVLAGPTTVFRLASDSEGIIARTAPGDIGNLGLQLVEVLAADVTL